MKELALPVRHDWLVRERAYGKIVIEPFEPGFALTAGNAYRRVLLSSIAGAAPTWVKIESVLHEFSYLPGVREDTLDIILNLRKLVFTVHVNRPKLLRLKVQGARTVIARDFDLDPDVEILVDQDPGVGQREPLALGPGRQEQRAHGGRLPPLLPDRAPRSARRASKTGVHRQHEDPDTEARTRAGPACSGGLHGPLPGPGGRPPGLGRRSSDLVVTTSEVL
jgi:RNA polymerase Rpb3/Rpb11